MTNLENEYSALQKQHSEAMLKISAFYKRMSKVTDSLVMRAVQSGIDYEQKHAADIRTRLEDVKAKMHEEWRKTRDAPR